MAESRLSPSLHKILMDAIHQLEIDTPQGVCFGTAIMGMQAFFAEDIETFSTRLMAIQLLYNDSPTLFGQRIKNADQLKEEISQEVIKNALQALEKPGVLGNPNLSQLDQLIPQEKKIYLNTLYKLIEEKIESLSDFEQIIIKLEISTFIKNLSINQNPNLYRPLFNFRADHQVQNAELSLPITLSTAVALKSGLVKIPIMPACADLAGIYNQAELVSLIKSIRSCFKSKEIIPFAFLHSSLIHTVMSGFYSSNTNLIFINVNDLEECDKPLSIADDATVEVAAEKILTALSKHTSSAMCSELFCLQKDANKVKQMVQIWRQNKLFRSIHTPTFAKGLRGDSEESFWLLSAAAAGEVDTVKSLLNLVEKGNRQNPNRQCTDGKTALHFATLYGKEAIVELLLTHTIWVDVNAEDKRKQTPLLIACTQGNKKVARLLLAAKASPNCKDYQGNTPLLGAIDANDTELVELLLKHGAKVNVLTKDTSFPLFIAAQEGYAEIVKLLLDHGADKNLQFSSSVVEIRKFAKEYHCISGIENLILAKKATETINLTAAEVAQARGFDEIGAIIENHEAKNMASLTAKNHLKL
ncbi:MAG: ankyrin repeat domain-containing protein [Gammaproteobacteria bacterium]|nr:ankyrin repeat domain-containing protein [Gammaproteobacteria bacterium]